MLILVISNKYTGSLSTCACKLSLFSGLTETHNVSFKTINLLQPAAQSQDIYGLSLNNLHFFFLFFNFSMSNLQKADNITFLFFLLQWLPAFVI